MNKKSKLILFALKLLVFIFIFLTVTEGGLLLKSTHNITAAAEQTMQTNVINNSQIKNLQKLCKVWGFVKYTHKSFILGLKDWDEELLSLIPVIRFAAEDEVNNILYKWVVGLGEFGYNDFDKSVFNIQADEEVIRYSADMSWICELYLGESLASILSTLLKLSEIEIVNRTKEPISFDHYGNSVFDNEKSYPDMDYSDDAFRLLALFRLWNAIEYYFPYKNILDDCWDDLLYEYICSMLEGTDALSYDLTLAALTSRLHDAHIIFYRKSSNNLFPYFDFLYGPYFAPVKLLEAEGCIVVSEVAGNRYPLKVGDVVLRLNGVDIDKITADMLQYLSYPNDEKALAYLAIRLPILRQDSNVIPMEIDVLRNDVELKIFTDTVRIVVPLPAPSVSHKLLAENIGLINPSNISSHNEIYSIMEDFVDTDGLIIDLRQRPSSLAINALTEYLLDKKLPYFIVSGPSRRTPGIFIDVFRGYSGSGSFAELLQSYKDIGVLHDYYEIPDTYFYKKNVVVLMNEMTASAPETAVMSLRNAPNVTVIGSNSMGANGDFTQLPLPDDLSMTYSGLGIYTSEGGQTQRIGLTPDIYVKRTVAGIREGRDELMEAAIKFLISK